MDTISGERAAALRRIPSLDAFLRQRRLEGVPRRVALESSREFLEELRAEVLAGRLNERQVDEVLEGEAERRVAEACSRRMLARHRRVINATGIVLHTGIGRAPLCSAARRALQEAAGYAFVEIDPAGGRRNRREEAVARLLTELTGAPAALVVNNNAAAVNLALRALACGREVVVSRGQLVEIGGGFRMPDVMAEAGCAMVEVGTTNRTRVEDYARAIGERTACLVIVHPSNFRIEGFAATPAREELVALAAEHGVAVVEDVGSGLLVDHPVAGLKDEPRVSSCVRAGVDVVCFSGDKLTGGPQCGLLVGRAEAIERLRAHPLYRAMRCDKLTLAALEATLRVYRYGEPLREIPVLRAITAGAAELERRARDLARALGRGEVTPSESFVGSGAAPARALPSYAVALPGGESVVKALRTGPGVPVIARIEHGRVLLDARTLCEESLDEVAEEVRRKLGAPRTGPCGEQLRDAAESA